MAKLSIVKGATSVLTRIFVQDSTSTTGAGKTGLTAASFTGTKVYVARDDDGNANGTALTITDSTRGTWASGGLKEKDATNMPGIYEFGLSNASLATGSRSCTYLFIGTGLVPLPLEIELTGIDNGDGVRGGMTALPNAAVSGVGGLLTAPTTANVGLSDLSRILGTALTETAGLLAGGFKKFFNVATPTGTVNSIPDAVAGATGGLFIAGTNAATAITTGLTSNLIGNITGNLSGSVGSVTGAVGSVTGAVGSVTGNVGGNVTGSVGSVVGLTASNLDATVSSRLASASYTAPPTSAQNATAVLTTQMTESYAADGAAPTLAQAAFLIQQKASEMAISGTTMTVKKLDGSTTAATFTLDSSTAPTSITRAT